MLFIWLLFFWSFSSLHLFLRSMLEIFDISIWWVSLWLFGTIHFKYMSLSLFPSQILVCAMAFSAHYPFLRFNIGWAFKHTKMSRKRYGHKSTHVSRSTKLLINHSWQVWRSIYNNHIDVKMFPTKIKVHREQAKLINAQSH